MRPSRAFTLNRADLINQGKSALIFLAPALIALLTVLTPQVAAIVPDSSTKAILLTFLIWLLNQATGMLRRFLEGKR